VRTIEKGLEPPCVAGLRREARRIERDTNEPPVAADWDPRDCGDAIREALCREQHRLCAYCMRRIRPLGSSMKIEHFVARARDPSRMYDWGNLLGVCSGVLQGGPEGVVLVCDTARGDRPLYVHPAKPPPRPEEAFLFEKTGKVRPVGEGATADCTTLNLNAQRLVLERRAVIDGLRRRLRRGDDPRAIRRLLEIASTPTQNGLPEHARVAIEYLQRKLRARER
jgi:uncharacterized protein (TIGR02646 family)